MYPLLGLFCLGTSTSAWAQYQLELTFDDQAEGTGEATGHAPVADLESGANAARLVGPAIRSGITEGRYGRGVSTSRGGWLEIGNLPPTPTTLVYMYVRPNDVSSGRLVSGPSPFFVGFRDGALIAAAGSPNGLQTAEFGLSWPAETAFHHLGIRVQRSANETEIFVRLDFEDEYRVRFPFSISNGPLRLGEGLDGIIDEVIIGGREVATRSLALDRFNRMPQACVGDLACIEEVLTTTPPGLSHEVPVRMKTVYDPARCTSRTPCPLAIEISGGGNCPNDYGHPDEIATLVALGFVVTTIDPYCEAGVPRFVPEKELPQLIVAKDYIFTQSAVRDRVEGPDYVASGCSHGADAVMIWSLYEEDHPARTFARSATGAGVCGHLAGKVCGFDPQNLDLQSPMIRSIHELSDFVGQITPQVAASREIARTWGVNLEGPVCNADGSFACQEEGNFPNTYASRRFRTVWERREPAQAPTGYFVEDVSADCQHCATFDSEAFRCGACLLRHGRAGMQTACPRCLSYEAPTIDHGGPAELCPLEASWYQDPLVTAPRPDAGPAPKSDGGMEARAPDAGVAPLQESSGCVCLDRSRSAWQLLFALGALAMLYRRR